MKIDRSNYEIWIIDWLDGNLSSEQEEELMMFLKENPDIQEESEELLSARLDQGHSEFMNKNLLIKEESDIPVQQFEYLCAAYLEGDLSPEQINELQAMMDNDPVKKRTFDLIQHTRLTPPAEIYRHKRSLIKLTPAGKFARTAVMVLSMAAAVALLISLYFNIPGNIPGKETRSAVNSAVPDTKVILQVQKGTPVISKNPVKLSPALAVSTPPEQKSASPVKPDTPVNNVPDSSLIRKPGNSIQIDRVAVIADIDLSVSFTSDNLVAYRTPSLPAVGDDYEDRNRLGKFIAKTFREKILREKTSSDAPLKAYEIAEAGITGLNKLLGWEMALSEKIDANGEISSVYFSSKVLKFNAPVKKATPLP